MSLWVIQRQYTQSVILNDNVHGLSANTWAYLSPGLPKSAGRFSEAAEYFSLFSSSKSDMSPSEVYCSIL